MKDDINKSTMLFAGNKYFIWYVSCKTAVFICRSQDFWVACQTPINALFAGVGGVMRSGILSHRCETHEYSSRLYGTLEGWTGV